MGEAISGQLLQGSAPAGLPNVLTIPSGAPFLSTLVNAMLDGRFGPALARGAAPLDRARATIYLPTRRAARALEALLAQRIGAGALLSPRIIPLGEADAIEARLEVDPGGPQRPPMPPPIEATARRLLLTQLTLAFGRSVDRAVLRLDDEPPLTPSRPADALALADALAEAIDAVRAEGADWARLADAAPERFDQIWAFTRSFLMVAGPAWPGILAERSVSDPVARRDALLRAEAARLRVSGSPDPVIVAGSTGAVPATAELMAAIAGLANGAVVLPGLSLPHLLDEPAWELIGGIDRIGFERAATHPQGAMKRTLAVIGVARADVTELGVEVPAAAARTRLLTRAMVPADATDSWAEGAADDDRSDAFAGITLVEAPDERLEALAIAVAVRETLETPDATAALITPDRGLAERVAVELQRWDVDVDDSAGQNLARTLAGRLAALAADAFVADGDPGAVLALLSHPSVRLGLSRKQVERGAAALELLVWRSPAAETPRAGLAEVLTAAAVRRTDRHAPGPVRRISDRDVADGVAVAQALVAAFAPMTALATVGHIDLVALAGAHRQTLARLTAEDLTSVAMSDDAQVLAQLFDDLAAAGDTVEGVADDYPALFRGLMADRSVVSGGVGHRRVRIWGLLEARLLTADRVILGGLVEGVWPPAADTGALLNRTMRAALGLGAPERRIGQTAHDFVQACGARDVMLTRARRRGGADALASRFLLRLRAVAGEPLWQEATATGDRYVALARRLDHPSDNDARPARRPCPKPAPAAQPVRYSVSDIETLLRDPFAIYARKVLRLDVLEPLRPDAGPALRGTLVHAAAQKLAQELARSNLTDARALAAEAAADALAQAGLDTMTGMVWSPRIQAMLAWLADWSVARHPTLADVILEERGEAPLTLTDGTQILLSARADRIERRRDGGLTLIDFKTGTVPSPKQVKLMLSPQLTLEAAIAARGGFAALGAPAESEGDIKAHLRMMQAAYIKLSGGEPAGVETRLVATSKSGPFDFSDAAEEHWNRLIDILDGLRDGSRDFRSWSLPQFRRDTGDYDHLARVKAWSSNGGAADSDAGGEDEA